MYPPGHRTITGVKHRLLERLSAVEPNVADTLRNLHLSWYAIRDVRNELDTDDGEQLSSGINSDTAEVFIYDEIGGSFGVTADDFVRDLNELTASNITLRINSPGGSVFDAITIMNALVQHPANILTRVDGVAASAASIVAMAGDTIEMMVGSQMMIHDASGSLVGNAAEMRQMATFLTEQSNNIAGIYASRGKGDTEYWRNLMLKETWMTADKAVELGLADQVYKPTPRQEVGKDMPPNKEMEETEESEETDDNEETGNERAVSDALATLMTRKHRLTNRGYRYTGVEKAPVPDPPTTNIDTVIAALRKSLL